MGYTKPTSTAAWKKLRAHVLSLATVCGICGRIWCPKCGGPVDVADHVLPVSRYPHLALDPTNVQAAHACCNRAKGNRLDYRVYTQSRVW